MASKGKTSKGRAAKSATLPLPEDKLKEAHQKMLLCRRFEEKTGQQYQMKKFSGFCHLYIGQEAVAVGSLMATEYGKDYAITTYRDHAHALLLGIPPEEIMAELFMKRTGSSKGKGGSMHFFNGKTRFLGGHGIVGGHTPIATGVGFASKYREEGAVVLCYMGDAAVNQGTFHESLNMAGLWDLPVIYIVENNLYGMGTAVTRSHAQPELWKRTQDAYKIPGVQVNGMDFLEVYEATKEAVDRARNESRPTFMEMKTYRYRGHSMSDPATSYRTKDEVSEWRTKDPILRLEEQFPDLFPEDYVKDLDKEIKQKVEDAIKFAEESEFPDRSDIWTHVYVDYPGYPGEDENPNKYAFPYEEYP
ncbi:MAG: pyruvate dehydrogenase (acetyl-transferring) E1 component subunit alpha [Candidatus Sumerlaeia bacterium]|nr:pyruvate dehydrogenase (acetyl-transferring) E1 component subunit alpha [Candidatus Sumerlaeia bacterium]